jgi:hypothetical protein
MGLARAVALDIPNLFTRKTGRAPASGKSVGGAYSMQMYPKMKCQWTKDRVIVQNAAEEAALAVAVARAGSIHWPIKDPGRRGLLNRMPSDGSMTETP